ncbi:MAG: alpha-galactosidase [Pseudomonadota bacterium]
MTQPDYFVLNGTRSTLILKAVIGTSPTLVYWGERLRDDTDARAIDMLRARQGARGVASLEVPISLSCEPGTGYLGPSGLEAHRAGQSWAALLRTTDVTQTDTIITLCGTDDHHGLCIRYTFTIDPHSDVVVMKTSLENKGDAPVTLDWLAVMCIPVQREFTEMISFSGRWAGEFATERSPIPSGGFIVENRRGRTSHDRFPGLILCTAQTQERRGICLGLHLGWSGNHRMRVDLLADGRAVVQAGEYFFPGEMHLAPGETYDTPDLFAQFSATGFSGMSAGFHDYYHSHMQAQHVAARPRPVHYNTWEGIYFDHDMETLGTLVDRAADLGVERFVLDDGWFRGRRHDAAGLGDWVVDETVYPDGLQPLIDQVNNRGMAFGLWVEPEMVNKDSDFFRAHPDWILGAEPAPHVPFRNQFVVDLSNRGAFANIFDQIDAILCEYPKIEYLKWDMNRDLSHPGGHDGTASVHRQTRALYKLIAELGEKHPGVEIESCSSGGARADFGILQYTDRIWTSDSNDALDRQIIQRGASYFFPLSVLGAHVGPRDCHITGRHLSMKVRTATALFGHMGVEADLLEMDDDDRDALKKAIALYKNNRTLIHEGRFIRMDDPPWQNTVGVIAKDGSRALYSCAILHSIPYVLPGVMKFPGLDSDRVYRLKVAWPTEVETPYQIHLETYGMLQDGLEVRGDILKRVGLQLPLMMPESCLVFEVKAV